MYHAGVTHSWLVVGAGRCGLQLARAMTAAGVALTGVAVRSPASRRRARRLLPHTPLFSDEATLPPAAAILVAVPDDALPDVAGRLSKRLTAPPRVVLHTSGLHPAGVLAPLAGRQTAVGSIHPLVSFPAPGGPLVPLSGVLAAVEGEDRAVSAARALARSLGMRCHRLAAADKPRYHAAAVLAANLAHALVVAAREQLGSVGFGHRDSAAALEPLVAGAVRAAVEARGWERLTGPLVRGDAGTVESHLTALPEELRDAYRAVSAMALARLLQAGEVTAPDRLINLLMKR